MNDYHDPRNLRLLLRAAERIPAERQRKAATLLIIEASDAHAQSTNALRSGSYQSDFVPHHRRALLKLMAAIHYLERTLDSQETSYPLLWRIQDVYRPSELAAEWHGLLEQSMSETLGYAGLP